MAPLVFITAILMLVPSVQASTGSSEDIRQILSKIEILLSQLSKEGVELPKTSGYVKQLSASILQTYDRELHQRTKKLHQQLENIWRAYGNSPRTAARAAQVLDEIYGLRGQAAGVASMMVDAAEQLVEQSVAPGGLSRSDELLSNAMTLTEAVKNIIRGGPIDIKVSKSSYSENDEAEISVASVSTSGGTVKIYVTEEVQRYNNETVVVTKSSFIGFGNTIIIQKEVIRNIQPTIDTREMVVGQNVAIGAVLNIRKALNQPALEKVEYDVAVRDYGFDRNYIRLVLTSQQSKTGRIIIIDVDKAMMKEYFPRDVSVRVDGTAAKLASDIVEVLNGDADRPTYFIAITGRGLQLVLYIPSWSTKVVLIGPSSSLSYLISIPNLLGVEAEFIATTAAAIILISALAIMRLTRPK
ncbi:MAG: hypothetical protein N3H84_04395 [Candidatus Caldarchaeum sp.]|nr:hypothetical protein [Candidatus Caldarchaeum sp.]